MKRHAPEIKGLARTMYREGIPRQRIAERLGVPRRTVHLWTHDIVCENQQLFTCVLCGRIKHVRYQNKWRKYCSTACRARAKHLRTRPKQLPRRCAACNKPIDPTARDGKAYCNKRCKDRHAQRRKRERERQAKQKRLDI